MYDKIEGRLAGATEYLTKPFDSENLKEVVRKILAVTAEVR
jgi:twitching motility two-component system response regulator PilG